MRSDDALKYAAAQLKSTWEWADDSIGGSGCDRDGHETELDAMSAAVNVVLALARQYGNHRIYSDGRVVESYADIQHGLVTHHVWHPDASQEECHSHRGSLPSGDPDVPSSGIYEVTTDPATQEIHVRVVRTA